MLPLSLERLPMGAGFLSLCVACVRVVRVRCWRCSVGIRRTRQQDGPTPPDTTTGPHSYTITRNTRYNHTTPHTRGSGIERGKQWPMASVRLLG